MSFNLRRAIAFAGVLTIIATACGGDDEPAPSPTATEAPAPADPPASTAAPAAVDAPAAPGTTAPAGLPSLADPDRTAQSGDAVSVHYVGTLDDGEEFDSSRGREPLPVVLGSGGVIPGFDAALLGMKIGDVKTVRIEVVDAYGEWTEERVTTIGIDQLPEGTVVGDELFASTGQRFVVIEIMDTEVRLDGNHQLAGQALTFELELVSFDN